MQTIYQLEQHLAYYRQQRLAEAALERLARQAATQHGTDGGQWARTFVSRVCSAAGWHSGGRSWGLPAPGFPRPRTVR